jgi:hypothetical protein
MLDLLAQKITLLKFYMLMNLIKLTSKDYYDLFIFNAKILNFLQFIKMGQLQVLAQDECNMETY